MRRVAHRRNHSIRLDLHTILQIDTVCGYRFDALIQHELEPSLLELSCAVLPQAAVQGREQMIARMDQPDLQIGLRDPRVISMNRRKQIQQVTGSFYSGIT